jgi:hypothetical protein
MRYKVTPPQRGSHIQLSFYSFIIELPSFGRHEAIVRLYIYKNKKTLHSWGERPPLGELAVTDLSL